MANATPSDAAAAIEIPIPSMMRGNSGCTNAA